MGQELARYSRMPSRRQPQGILERIAGTLAPKSDPTELLRLDIQYLRAHADRSKAECVAIDQAIDLEVQRTTLPTELALRLQEKQVGQMETEWSLKKRLIAIEREQAEFAFTEAVEMLATKLGMNPEQLEVLLRNAKDRASTNR